MSVDVVVANYSDLQSGHNIADGALAWCTNDQILAVQNGLGGDWVAVGQGGRTWVGTPSYNGTLTVNTSVDVSVPFPAGLFTQPPVVAPSVFSSRLNASVVSVTKDGCVIRLSNFSNANSTDGIRTMQVIAVQQY